MKWTLSLASIKINMIASGMNAQELVHDLAKDIMTLYSPASEFPSVEGAQSLEREKTIALDCDEGNSTHHSSRGDANVVRFDDSAYNIADAETFRSKIDS